MSPRSKPTLELVSSKPTSDEQLLLAVARDDREAFRELSTRFADRLARFCGHATKEGNLGEDLAQDVLVAVWNARTLFTGGDAAAWIFTFAVNRCRKHQRWFSRWLKAKTKAELLPFEAPAEPFEILAKHQLLQRARVAIAALPQELQEAVWLRLEGQLNYRSVGDALGCSEGAARVRVFTALKRLRAVMGGDE